MDATPIPILEEPTTRAMMRRLWREHVRHHRMRLLVVLVLTAIMAGSRRSIRW